MVGAADCPELPADGRIMFWPLSTCEGCVVTGPSPLFDCGATAEGDCGGVTVPWASAAKEPVATAIAAASERVMASMSVLLAGTVMLKKQAGTPDVPPRAQLRAETAWRLGSLD
jgi:hypothetical protein